MNIIIIEDDAKTASFVSKGLQQAGFNTVVAPDGKDGLFKIQVAVDARRFGIGQWWLVLLLAVLTGVIGLLLVLRPTEGAQALVMLMGASLFLDGALNLSVALCAVKVVRHQQPDVIETDDYEIE